VEAEADAVALPGDVPLLGDLGRMGAGFGVDAHLDLGVGGSAHPRPATHPARCVLAGMVDQQEVSTTFAPDAINVAHDDRHVLAAVLVRPGAESRKRVADDELALHCELALEREHECDDAVGIAAPVIKVDR
jgi:hypothetical protein